MKKPLSSRRVMIPLGIGTVISLLGDATLYTVLPNPSIAAHAGVSLAMVGLLLGVNRAARLVVNGPIGLLYDRLPRRGLMVFSLVIGTFSNLLYVIGGGFWTMLAGRILWGAAWALLWIGGNAIVLDISDDQNRGRISGQYQMWFFIGVASSSFLGGLFTDLFGFRGGLGISTVLTGLAALMWLLFLPETHHHSKSVSTSKTQPGTTEAFPLRPVLAASVPLFAMRFIFAGVVAATTILWLETLVGDSIELGEMILPLATMTGAFGALRGLLSILSAPAAGFLSDRIRRRWPVILIVMFLGAGGMWLMSVTNPAWAIAGAFTAAITGGSAQTIVPAIAGDRVIDAHRGRSLGLIYIVGDLGSTLGPPVALGLLNANLTDLGGVYQGCAALFALVGLFALIQMKREVST